MTTSWTRREMMRRSARMALALGVGVPILQACGGDSDAVSRLFLSSTGWLLTDQSVGTRYDEAMRRTDPRPTTLSGRDYTSQEVFDLERERIFHRGWYYIGRSDPIAAGDRLVVDVVGESVLVVRDRDGALRAHANVCRHRGARLCDESGTGARGSITCPYHAWSYAMDGRLIATPNVAPDDLDRDALSLWSIAVDEWEGFAFVSLASSPPPPCSTG